MSGAGKGDRYRPVDQKVYGDNYDRVFKQKTVIPFGDEKHICTTCPEQEACYNLWCPERQKYESKHGDGKRTPRGA
jgi:hypothetical protein